MNQHNSGWKKGIIKHWWAKASNKPKPKPKPVVKHGKI